MFSNLKIMDRRHFLKYSALGLLALSVDSKSLFSKEVSNGDQCIIFNPVKLPLLFDVDVLVIGGGFAGIGAADKLTAAGKSVAIIDTKTFLGDEATSFSVLDLGRDISSEFRKVFADTLQVRNGGSFVNPITAKEEIEILTEQRNIEMMYATTAVNIQPSGKGYIVVVANKSGFQAIRAGDVVDATPTMMTQYLINASAGLRLGAESSISIEFTGCDIEASDIALPKNLGIKNNRASLRNGYVDQSHRFVDITVSDPDIEGCADPLTVNMAEMKLRLKAHDVVKYLVNNVTGFANAYYVHLSYSVRHSYDAVPKDAEIAPRVWCAHPALCNYNPSESYAHGMKVAEKIIYTVKRSQNIATERYSRKTDKITYTTDPVSGAKYERIDVEGFRLNTLDGYDTVVAGGGTSGATAADISSCNGLKTILIEQIHGLGGTGTFGGVHVYWFGRRGGFNTGINRRLDAEQKAINNNPIAKNKWNIEIKNYVLARELVENRCDLLFNSFVCGTIIDRSKVEGVVVATPYGPLAIMSRYVIDATGDGDVAAFAGAKFTYGSRQNYFPMYYAFCFSRQRGVYQSKFDAMLNSTNIFDLNRVIKVNRKLDKSFDHAPFVATRETRHIEGDVTLTLEHLFSLKEWDDVVNIHFSNNDIKGHHSSDWWRLGIQPPNYEVEIPYRALMPAGIDNVIVVGKAFSADHDAYPTLRMQPDLENLGGVAAIACLEAKCSDTSLRGINVKPLQKRLVELDILPAKVLTRTIKEDVLDRAQIETLIANLECKPLTSYAIMPMNEVYRSKIPFIELCMAGERAEDALEQELKVASPEKQVFIAKILAFIGSDKGVGVILREIDKMLSTGTLPRKGGEIPHSSHVPPNQCAMPELGYLLNTLAMCRTPRAIPVWKRVIDMMPLTEEALRDDKSGLFYYVDAICYGAERLASPDAVSLLKELRSKELFFKQNSPDTDGSDIIKERRAMLELEIASALAASDSKDGFEILIDYLDDNRSILAEYANFRLRNMTGRDFGKDKERWSNFILYLV